MMQLTILFDCPYWVGILEEERDGYLYAARHIFGAEPSDQEVYQFVLDDLLILRARMTVGAKIKDKHLEHRINPKRLQRDIKRELQKTDVSSKAREAMRLQIEQSKQVRKQQSRDERQAERERQRTLATEKAKARHRGR